MKAKNIAIILCSVVICCAAAKTYSSLQNEEQKVNNAEKACKTEKNRNVKSEECKKNEKVKAVAEQPENNAICYNEYRSSQKYGVIGLYGGNSVDNPEDDIFDIFIPQSLSSKDKVMLSYDVEGVTGMAGVALSINDRTAMGGVIAYASDKVVSVKEEIDASWLQKGKNRFMFTLPDSANYGYKISNIKVDVQKNASSESIVASALNLNGEIYVRGFVKDSRVGHVTVDDVDIKVERGAFEALLVTEKENVVIVCSNSKKTLSVESVAGCSESTRFVCVGNAVKISQKEFSLEKKDNNKIQDVAVSLSVDSGIAKKDMKISMINLRHKDLPALDLGMHNVTDSVSGYRFLPHGVHFKGDGAQVSLKYDRTKIPSGYTEDDIRTYYFDLESKHWVALKRDSIDKANNLIVSRTTHFTDMINGVIQTPESPETQGFTPTMMSDLKLADPTAKIQSIAPPTANNRGSANLSYSFEMPPARHGMQPNLGIQYNSDGGSGLLGEGWDLSVPTISVETRWGVPIYDSEKESETYNMDGSMLVMNNGMDNYLAHREKQYTGRKKDAIFHPRKEGAFSKIIRKGENPKEYTWEVTDNSGTKYYYGKKNPDGTMSGVLMGDKGIAEWKLVRMQELHGDWVEYKYEVKEEIVAGTKSKTLLLTQISAGNSGEPSHTDVRLNYGGQKKKVQRMANYGFLVSNPYLLKSVEVKYTGKDLRSYEFSYDNNAPFHADLLTSIIHKDAKNVQVSKNTLEYYNNVSGGLAFNSEMDYSTPNDNLDMFGPESYGELGGVRMLGGTTSNTFSFNAYGGVGPATESVVVKSLTVGGNFAYSNATTKGVISFMDIDGDGLADKVIKKSDGEIYYYPFIPEENKFGNIVKIEGISDISESTSSTTTYGGNANAIGGLTAGVSKGNVDSETSIYFSDVNGDGLPDLVNGSTVYFNRLINDEAKTNGSRKIAKFEATSDGTPNPIVGSLDNLSQRSQESINEEKDRLEKKQKEKVSNSPMHDVVRVWKAPYSGNIKLSGLPKFVGSNQSEIKDGVAVSIQKGNSYLFKPTILNYSILTPSWSIQSQSISVKKGDRIYFRVQSGTDELANGEDDRVEWNPIITYTDTEYNQMDPNEMPRNIFSAKDAHLLSSRSEGVIDVDVTKNSKHSLSLTIDKKKTTDVVSVIITVHNDKTIETEQDAAGEKMISSPYAGYSEVVVYEKTFSAETETVEILNEKDITDIVFQDMDHPLKFISCKISSPTNIDWSKVSFSAKVKSKKGETTNPTILGVPVFVDTYTENSFYGSWTSDYGNKINEETTYSVHVTETETEEKTISKSDLIDKLVLVPQIKFETTGALKTPDFRLAVKDENGKLLGNINLEYADGKFSEIKISDYQFFVDWFSQENPNKLWIEYYADLKNNESASEEEQKIDPSFIVTESNLLIEAYENTKIDKTEVDDNGDTHIVSIIIKDPIYSTLLENLNVSSNRLDEIYGPMYKGWGQFAYNSAKDERFGKVMDETKLGVSAYNDMADKYNSDQEENKFTYDRNDMAFMAMQPDYINNVWNGQAVYETNGQRYTNCVGAELMVSARQGEQNVIVEDLLSKMTEISVSGGKAVGFPIISEAESETTQGGALGLTKSSSDGSSNTVQTFSDMNGDGYPDLVKNKEILYTGHLGGLNGGNEYFKDGLLDKGGSEGKSYGAGNEAIHSFPSQMKAAFSHNGKSQAQEQAAEKARASVSIGKSGSNDWTNRSMVDMNGDGLPDIVSVSDNQIKVKLNLGYDFTPDDIIWGDGKIRESSSSDVSIGGSFDFCGSSYSAGLNASGATSNINYDLRDVNADGLPDLVTNSGVIRLNTGTGFGDVIPISGLSSLGKSTSLNGSVNGNGTAGFYVWLLRVSISGGAAFGKGLSGEEFAYRDFDADGYPDLVSSESEEEMNVHLSKVGATNKLRFVTTPLGGKYELGYSHSRPTQQHPGGKWVMSKLTVVDAFRGVDNCPKMVSEFDYSGGKRDRRERDFYGFAKVMTKSMDGSTLVRKMVQHYDTTNYYTSGTVIGSYICDDKNHLFSKDTTEISIFSVTENGTTNSVSVIGEKSRLFVAPIKTASYRYEGNNYVLVNVVDNEYGNFGNLTSYTYTDGIANTGYTTTISYAPYNAKYNIFGLPTSVTVKSDGKTQRQITAQYDKSGYNPSSMVKMTQTLDDGEAVVEIKYDTLGNIIEKTMPKGIDGKRMKFTYEYDKEHRMYPIRVTDAFGYRSDLFNYDYRYGIPLMVKDMNGFMTEYEIDDLGRVTKVTAPNELSSGAPYTILYHYGNADSVNFARTYHYDPQHPNDPMVTASIVDGLGRAYQVKKNAEVKGEREMIVSGLTTFDGLGREIAHFAPSTCSLNDWGRSSFDVSTKLDETVYDAFDRPLTQTAFSKNSGAYVSTTAYSIEDNMLKTTVEDNNGDSHLRMHTYMDGSERTLRTVKDHTASGDEPAPTTFVFDGINQLLFVIDAMNDTTAYTYDKAGRKLSVTHPSAGKTTFTYDNCGNVLSKETSKGKVEYKYEYNRLIEQTYGDDKWKNNVKYTYGGVDAKHNRVGRLALVEDGSGAQEYFYGKMGEVEKIRRTLIIPGVDVATYTTSWKYDSWNRIQEMVYPDGEKIKYTYNLGGQLTKIVGEKNYICTYIDDIQYDAYEQRSYMRYGNGSETHYEYDPVNRRLDNMKVSNEKSRAEGAEKGLFIDNSYSYDDAGNITQVSNSAALNMGIGGTMTHTYAYDDWYRLKSATGEFNSADKSKSAAYNLLMSYDNLYNIMSKKLTMSQTNLQFKGTLSAGHEFAYTYSDDNPMRLASVETKQYNLDKADVEADAELAKHVRTQNYEFDGNGNMTSVSVDTVSSLKSYLWDEENRLLAVNNNGSVSSYFYDAAGERTVKLSSESEMVHVNGRKVGSNAAITKFTAYVSPYFVVSNGGAYTKHIYAASQRIASKLGSIDGFGADPRRVEQAGDGKLKIDEKFQVQTGTIKTRHDSLGISYEQPKAKDEVEKDSAMDSSDPEKLVFFYHPDHLGSTSYVTDFDGNVTQHVEYIPYGEIFMEERNSSFSTPYLFNAKELDDETGLYYYGARYFDPTGAMWLSVDPLFEKYAGMSPYNYCSGNPVKFIDPDGMDYYSSTDENGNEVIQWQDSEKAFYIDEDGNSWEYYSAGQKEEVVITPTQEQKQDIKEKRAEEQDRNIKKYWSERAKNADSWDAKFGYWLKSKGGYNADEKFSEAARPIVQGAVLFNPIISLTNSGKTLITGSDIYGNEAENVDYALSVVDIATFGCGNFMKLPKTVKTANTVVSKSATGGTIYRTSSTEFNKKDEKK